MGLINRIVLAKLDSNQYFITPPIPLNSFNTYSFYALEIISIDKALIALFIVIVRTSVEAKLFLCVTTQ